MQHAKLDTLMVESLAAGRNEEEIMNGVEEYLEIGGFIDGGLKQQVEFDLSSFERASGRELTELRKKSFGACNYRRIVGLISAGHDSREGARDARVAHAKGATES